MTKTGKIAVLGDSDCVLAFKAVGLESFEADDESSAKEVLRKLTKGDYSVVFITEDVAIKIADTLEMLKERTYPAIIPIPSSKQSNNYGMLSIKKDVEKAIGADILFKD